MKYQRLGVNLFSIVELSLDKGENEDNYSGSKTNHAELIQQPPVFIQQQQSQSQETTRSSFAPPHASLPEACMNDLLMRTLNRTAAYPITQPQVLVVAHPRRVFTIVTDENVQALPCFWRAGSHPFESTDHALFFTRAQVFCDC